MKAVFSQIGGVAASTVKADSPHPLVLRTETLGYGVVLEGELTLALDDSEVELKVGSVVKRQRQAGFADGSAARPGPVLK